MQSTSTAARTPPREQRDLPRSGSRGLRVLLGGGIDGNEQLTAMTGVILIVLLAVLGVTILRIGQLIWLHLFLGLLLLGPVLLKLISTAYRFARYYMRAAVYIAKGPPMLALRAMGPLLVLSTVVVFATGVALLFLGPRNREPSLVLHKASFVIWLGLFGLHLLAHVPGLPRSLRAVQLGVKQTRRSSMAATGSNGSEGNSALAGLGGGAAGRWIVLVGALVAGVILAVVLIPHFGVWTAPGAFPQHHHDG